MPQADRPKRGIPVIKRSANISQLFAPGNSSPKYQSNQSKRGQVSTKVKGVKSPFDQFRKSHGNVFPKKTHSSDRNEPCSTSGFQTGNLSDGSHNRIPTGETQKSTHLSYIALFGGLSRIFQCLDHIRNIHPCQQKAMVSLPFLVHPVNEYH